MTSKQRAYLRGLANNIDAIFQVGKGGVSDVLLEQLSNAIEARELIKITVLETEVDDTLISEETRRETVKVIIKQLRTQEFTVEKPQVVQTDGKNYVKIVAKQPSGKRAICNIDLHGKIAYKFDNYEGMTCLKDIEKFNVDLQQVYSVKLSDERVLWSNPDKLDRDANRTYKTDRRGD